MENYLGAVWKAAGIARQDAMLAVSATHVVVKVAHQIAFFAKDGKPLGPVLTDEAFYETLNGLTWDAQHDMLPQKLPAGIVNSEVAKGLSNEKYYGDPRILFDTYRRRFWVISTHNAWNRTVACTIDMTNTYSQDCIDAIQSYPRMMIAIAVSKSENPLDGWHTYKIPATPLDKNGNPNLDHGADFPMIGIDRRAFYVTINVGTRNKSSDHSSNDIDSKSFVSIMDADKLANGTNDSKIVANSFMAGEGTIVPPVCIGDQTIHIQNPNDILTTEITSFVRINDENSCSIFDLRSPLFSPFAHIELTYGHDIKFSTGYEGKFGDVLMLEKNITDFKNSDGTPIYPNGWRVGIGNIATSVVSRNGNVYVTSYASMMTPDSAYHVVGRLSVFKITATPQQVQYTQTVDQIIGPRRSDDPQGRYFDYTYPACAVNQYGDAGIVSMRTHPDTYPELRASAYSVAEGTMSESLLIRAGQSAADPDGFRDCFAAVIDPDNDASIWVIGQTAGANNVLECWVGQIFSSFGGPFSIRAAIAWPDQPARGLSNMAYFFRDQRYIRYDIGADKVDQGPRKVLGHWPGLAEQLPNGIDTVMVWPDDPKRGVIGIAFFFGGASYVRYSIADDTVSQPVKPILKNWPGLGETFPNGIDSAVVWPVGRQGFTGPVAFFFKGSKFAVYDIKADKVVKGPLPILHSWPGLGEVFPNGIDTVLVVKSSTAYFFKGGKYVRYDIASDKVSSNGSHDIGGNWSGL